MKTEIIELLRDVREFARQPYTWPGGYPIILIMHDGECLCAKCARSEYRLISDSTRNHRRDGWQAEALTIHWEGAPIECAHCGKEIESAYGVPEDDQI